MPRLASASGEEWARRAMPTRSGAGPGGSRASGPLSRWFGTSGNKVGVGSLQRPRRALLRKEGFSEAEGIEVAVAITRLAKHGRSISLFVRFVNHYFRLSFASPPGPANGFLTKFRRNRNHAEVTFETLPARRKANVAESRAILDRHSGSGTWLRSAF